MKQSSVDIASVGGGRSLGKACCTGCLLFIVVLVVVSGLAIRTALGPMTVQISALPPHYPSDLTLYQVQTASSMTYLARQQKGRIAKFLSLPVGWVRSVLGDQGSLDAYTRQFEKTDKVTVTWHALPAARAEILRYYQDLFQHIGMSASVTHDDVTGTDSVIATRGDAAFQMLLQSTTGTAGVDQMVITVDYTNQ